MVTENRPGAGQTIGSGYAAKADPDGHTLLLVTVTYTTSAAIYTKLPFDPLADLTGIAMVGKGPLLLTVHPSLPAKSVKELIALAKAKPGNLDFGSAGAGTIPHLATELFAGSARINIVHVPYKGIAPAVTATVAGEVPVLIASTPAFAVRVMDPNSIRSSSCAPKLSGALTYLNQRSRVYNERSQDHYVMGLNTPALSMGSSTFIASGDGVMRAGADRISPAIQRLQLMRGHR